MRKSFRRYLGFALTVLAWSLVSVWVEIWYLLLFNLVLLDMFITRRVDWTLRRYGLPRHLQSSLEWILVLILAVVFSVALKALFVEAYKIPTPSMEETLLAGDFIFVSKLAYGPRLPGTPLSLPFYHNKLPSGKKSYSARLQLPYKRLRGLSRVRRNDIIVFNFPEGDTMVVQYPGQNYYSLVRQYGREYILDEFDITTHPVDRRENYVKRCIGLPGDRIQIVDGNILINDREIAGINGQKYKYYVTTYGQPLPEALTDSLRIDKSSVTYNPVNSLHVLYLTHGQLELLRSFREVRSIKRYSEPRLSFQNQEIFPHDRNYRWTGDNFGPLKVPARGDSIGLDLLNLPLFSRIIDVYEDNDLQVTDGRILINGVEKDTYTFGMDYYFVIGDNYHNSADSRYWGFVPEDHLLGKAVMVWFSMEPEKAGMEGLRKQRIFNTIK